MSIRSLIFSLICFQGLISLGQSSFKFNQPSIINLSKFSEHSDYATLQFDSKLIHPVHDIPFFTYTAKGRYSFEILSTTYLPISSSEKLLVPDDAVEIPKQAIGIQAKQAFSTLSIPAIKKENNQYYYLSQIEFKQSNKPAVNSGRRPMNRRNAFSFTGQALEIEINESGIYRISKSFLEDNGLSTSGKSPNQLAVFGIQGGELDELISSTDFLWKEIATQKSSNGNSSFESDEFILVYLEGPDRWKLNTDRTSNLEYVKHSTDRTAHYYLGFISGDSKSIQVESEISEGILEVNSLLQAQAVEEDDLSLAKSGKLWYEEALNSFETSRAYSFNFSDRDTDYPVRIRIQSVGRSVNGACNSEFFYGNTLLSNITYPKVNTSYVDPVGRERTLDTAYYGSLNSDIQVNFIPSNSDVESKLWIESIETVFFQRPSDQDGMESWYYLGTDELNGISFNAPTLTGNVWNISNFYSPKQTNLQGNTITTQLSDLTRIIHWKESDILNPKANDIVEIRDLLSDIDYPDYIIIAPTAFIPAATRLANHHSTRNGFRTEVINIEEVYTHFSSGNADVSAVRNLMAHLYHSAPTDDDLPRYLCLFGDATYDVFKKENQRDISNYLLTYHSPESNIQSITFSTDDYFACLDIGEGSDLATGNQRLDLAVGRLAAETVSEANALVDKILFYESPETFGSWRNKLSFIADDQDVVTHVRGANNIANMYEANIPTFTSEKIFIDAYPQIATPGGDRYPAARQDIFAQLFNGSVFLSFTGHGGVNGWTQERIFVKEDVPGISNLENMPIWVTATCSFSRIDDPEIKSGGELVHVSQTGAGVALVTTSRLVYSSDNDRLSESFTNAVIESNQLFSENILTLGEIVTKAKNGVTTTSFNDNARKFSLLGDPAMYPAIPNPSFQILTTSINGKAFTGVSSDTLSALEQVNISGEVHGRTGIEDRINGEISLIVYDKIDSLITKANDPRVNPGDDYSLPYAFNEYNNVLFNGRATVEDGKFTISFIMPKDLKYSIGEGKLSYYGFTYGQGEIGAFNTTIPEAFDFSGRTDILVGGASKNGIDDTIGPDISIFLNDETFVNGGITNSNPTLVVKLQDKSGINTSNSSIGHGITAVIDGDVSNTINLNTYYSSELNDYSNGRLEYQLTDLEPGDHTVSLKAWDVANNPNEQEIQFKVISSDKPSLRNVLNYPNPFTTNTQFWFEHNKPNEQIKVQVIIFTIDGRPVNTLNTVALNEGNNFRNLEWNGTDAFGRKLPPGTYWYRLSVTDMNNNTKSVDKKMVILR